MNICMASEQKDKDIENDFEIIPEEKQQMRIDTLEEVVQKIDDRAEIEEINVSSEDKNMVESSISDNEPIIGLYEKNLSECTETLLPPDQQEGKEMEITSSSDVCEVPVQYSSKTDNVQDDLYAKDVDKTEPLEFEEENTEEVPVKEIEPKQMLEELNDNNKFDEDISEAIEKADSSEQKISSSEEEIKLDCKKDCKTLTQVEDQLSCSQQPADPDTVIVNPELADTEEVTCDETSNMDQKQEELPKDDDVEVLSSETTAEEIVVIDDIENGSKIENHGSEIQDIIKAKELCDETSDIEAVESIDDDSAVAIEDVEELSKEENVDATENKTEPDLTVEESHDQVSNIGTVEPTQETLDDDHNIDEAVSNAEENVTTNQQTNCEHFEDVMMVESTANNNQDACEESENAEITQSNQESKQEDCSTLEKIPDQELAIETKDNLHLVESVSKLDRKEDEEPVIENVVAREIEQIGSIENNDEHSVNEALKQTDVLNSPEDLIDVEIKDLNTEEVKEENLQEEEDIFSKVIDNCKMEIENIQNSIIGSVETEEIGKKENMNENYCSSPEVDQDKDSSNQEKSDEKIVSETKSAFLDNESDTTGNQDECETREEATTAQEEETVCSEKVDSLSNNPNKDYSNSTDKEKVEDQSRYSEQATEEYNPKSVEEEGEMIGSISDELDILSSNEKQKEKTESVPENTENKAKASLIDAENKDTRIASNNGFSNENESLEDITTTKETDAECSTEVEITK